MERVQRTHKLLTETEKTVAGFASEASASRDYDQAASLIALARQINELAEQLVSGAQQPGTPSDSEGPMKKGHPVNAPGTSTMRRSKLGQYPRFVREENSLVKIGWSKSERAEYEHKSPRRLLAILCEALTGANGKRITMERVLPLKDPTSGSTFPDYQSYVCLAWLRSAGLVIQHGRQGYSLRKGIDLQRSAEAQWASLPSR